MRLSQIYAQRLRESITLIEEIQTAVDGTISTEQAVKLREYYVCFLLKYP